MSREQVLKNTFFRGRYANTGCPRNASLLARKIILFKAVSALFHYLYVWIVV